MGKGWGKEVSHLAHKKAGPRTQSSLSAELGDEVKGKLGDLTVILFSSFVGGSTMGWLNVIRVDPERGSKNSLNKKGNGQREYLPDAPGEKAHQWLSFIPHNGEATYEGKVGHESRGK